MYVIHRTFKHVRNTERYNSVFLGYLPKETIVDTLHPSEAPIEKTRWDSNYFQISFPFLTDQNNGSIAIAE